jgi:hypothetical protein
LIPTLIESHGHCADEGLDAGGGLVVGRSKPPPDVLVIQNLDLKGEVLLELNGKRFTFLMIITRKGSLMPNVSCGF